MIILKEGNIINQVDLKLYPYEIKIIDEDSINDIISVQNVVLGNLENKELCAVITADEYLCYLGENGICLGTFVNDKLIGFYCIYFPKGNVDNLYVDIGLEEEERNKVIHLEACNLLYEYRGNNLQKIMADFMLKKISDLKCYNYLAATVSPINFPSLFHLFYVGMYIIDIKIKYGGMTRFICFKDLVNSIELDKNKSIKYKNIDIKGQKEILKKGYIGYKQIREKNDIYIVYAPFLKTF